MQKHYVIERSAYTLRPASRVQRGRRSANGGCRSDAEARGWRAAYLLDSDTATEEKEVPPFDWAGVGVKLPYK